ncbi:hypothetical protein F2P56_033971 [Juglans regia]|uniref:PGG domain-containing protein n=1 Tax=Juglans regia TaxID=51240 RepID=A0A833WTW4_JUGRE|nr:hypothetical protein F2P56_033971 [Juglans regia]
MSTQPNQPAVSSLEMDAQPMMRPIQPDQTFRDDWVSYFQYKPERDSASDVRSALLVVMALIAAATFQAGLNPPGGVWQDNKNDHGIWIGLVSFSATYGISTASLNLRGAACLNELLVAVAFFLPLVTLFARYPLKRAWRKLSTHQSTDQ